MPNKKRHSWAPPEWLLNPESKSVIFHDKPIEVYEGQVEIGAIRLWRDNDRTSLDIAHLAAESGIKDVSKLSDDQIIKNIIEQGLHKITDLADSIRLNGVRLPLILTYEKELLDGNRRFIACKYLLASEKKIDNKFKFATAYCLKPHISNSIRHNIISEMNFLPDFKEKWPQAVRAKHIVQLFKEYKAKYGKQQAINKVVALLETDEATIYRFIYVLKMIKDYIIYAKKQSEKAKSDAEIFTREKFHFFEEFYNKNLKDKQNKNTVKEDKYLFYSYLFNKELVSTTGIRSFAAMLQYPAIKKVIKAHKESLDYAKSMHDDIIFPKRASSKIERFCVWLERVSKNELHNISSKLKERLLKAIKRIGN
jgi:hypothetical protein